MPLRVQFENLGKLAGASVLVRPFTVLAGPNNTGKSFFSKSLYSVFHAMHANHAQTQMQRLAEPLRENILDLKISGFDNAELEALEGHLKRLEDLCRPISGQVDEIAAVESIHADLAKAATDFIRAYEALRPDFEGIAEADDRSFNQRSMERMRSNVEDVAEIPKRTPKDIVLYGFGGALAHNLIGNFQVPILTDLKQDAEQDASLTIKDDADGGRVGAFTIKKNTIDFDAGADGWQRLQTHSRVIYLESPIHWKLRGALRMVSSLDSPFASRMSLAVPKYFRDLDNALDADYSGEVAFPDVLQRLTGDVMRGKITLAKDGRLVFNEFGRGNFNLPMASTGVANLGVLALLVERKIIDKGTFVFIDEPESNLHQQWHEEMVRALFDLVRGGVKIVIATHSVNILKWIDVHVKNNPDDKGLIALNHFSDEGVVNGGKGFSDKLSDIMIELTRPFHELRLREF